MRSFLSIATSVSLLLSLMNPAIAATPPATTPIQHVVIIFGENISFDHYFGTYPHAANPPGQPRFTALPGTPAVNGLSGSLLTNNPNLNPANGTGAANPFRLNRNQALTADQGHSYTPEQQSFDNFQMDLFPSKTGSAGGAPNFPLVAVPPAVGTKGLVMAYFDGNTVTGLWNYAQNFAMSDNSYNSQFGPSTPGAINVIAGQTNGINATLNGPSSAAISDGQGGMSLINDADPIGDVCSGPTKFQVSFGSSNKNVGDLLNAQGLTWGWFNGGFDLTVTNPNGSTLCNRSTVSPITGLAEGDYVPHHQPFQYYASTANPTHARPSSVAAIGTTDAANHQYDTHDFFDALSAGNLANVSYLKAPSYQDAHPGNSNPLDEQAFVVNVVNSLEQSPFWNSTAVILAYDDSDGWYDHQSTPLTNASFSNSDALTGTNACGVPGTTPQLPGPNSLGAPVNGRCGPGVRTPLQVISPWAQANFVDHTLTTQSSVLRFIEDNWSLGRIGGGSFDATAGTITNMFNFANPNGPPPNTNLPILSPITGN
jgi:phospholipase C